MSIFFADFKIIGRSKGQSAVASAAYQAGEDLIEDESHEKKRFSKKAWQVKYSEIMLPENAPKKYADRATLWNAVQKKEKAKNAQFARKAVFALPKELDRETQIKLSRTYIQENFVNQGMVADWALHDKGDGNPHVHIQLTTRPFTKSGKWGAKRKTHYKLDKNGERIPKIDPKTGNQLVRQGRKQWEREYINLPWDNPENVTKWRNAWEKTANLYLKEINAPEISAKSYKDLGIDRIPTLHEGYYARKMEQLNPGSSRVIAINRAIKLRNHVAETVETVTKQVNDLVDRTLKERSSRLDGILSGSGEAERNIDQTRYSRGLSSRIGTRKQRVAELVGSKDQGIENSKSRFTARKRRLAELTRDFKHRERRSEQSSPGSQSRIEAVRRTVQEGLNRQSIRDTGSPTPNKRMETSLQTAREQAGRLRKVEVGKARPTEASQSASNPTPRVGQVRTIFDIIKQLITWLTDRLERGRRQRAELERERQNLKVQIAAAEKLKEQAKTKSQQAKKPEKTAKVASKQPVQVQSNPVDHPDRPKEPQNRSIEHDQEQKAWRMAYTLCTIPSMLTLAARKGVAALMTLEKADTKQATATQKRAAIAMITKDMGLKSEFDYLASQDFGKAYTSILADYLVLGTTGAFSTPEAIQKYEKGFVQYEKWFEDNQEPEKALEKYFKDAKQQAERVLTVYNRMSEKDFPRPQQTPPRRQSRGRSR
ncbi:MobA/MobL family protein (plasmid) [Ligilactobacillus saerimneri]|uniref:MobA/MobL family protein n=1 Tax=Ligilactobacillus saerimneri TaxID=228229 RepID=UPI0030CD94FE